MSKKKREKQHFPASGFYIIALTVLLWIAFLFKVFKQNTHPEPAVHENDRLSAIAPESLKPQSQENPTHKQPEKRQNQPEQAAIESLAKSLGKKKPVENIIIRGESFTLIKATGRNKKANNELIINQKNLKNLNADYIDALKK